MKYIVLSIGTVLHLSVAGFVLMLTIFGTAALVNKEGAVGKIQKKLFSRALLFSFLSSFLFTIALFFLAATNSRYYSPWWLVLPLIINFKCVHLVLSVTEKG